MPDLPISGLAALPAGGIQDGDKFPIERSSTNYSPTALDHYQYTLQKLLGRLVISVDIATTGPLPSANYTNGASGVGATLEGSSNGVLGNIDSTSTFAGQRVLVKDQVNEAHNGVYLVSSMGSVSSKWLLTRITDADQPVEFPNQAVLVKLGTVNIGTLWLQIQPVISAVGTSNIIYARSINPNLPIAIDYTDWVTEFAAGTLKVYQDYLVTTVNGDLSISILVRTGSTSQTIQPDGTLFTWAVNTHEVLYTWIPGDTVLSGDKRQYGGVVFTNLTGVNGTAPSGDLTNWSQLPYTDSGYIYMGYGVSIRINHAPGSVGELLINHTTDRFGNIISGTDLIARFFHTGAGGGATANYSKQANLIAVNFAGLLFGNALAPETTVTLSGGSGEMSGNRVSGGITIDEHNGILADNDIQGNITCTGGDFQAELRDCKIGVGNWVLRSGVGYSIQNKRINKVFSEAEDMIDNSAYNGSGQLMLDINGNNEIYGVYWIDGNSGGNGPVNYIKNPPPNISRLTIRPNGTNSIMEINPVSAASANADEIVGETPGVTLQLNSDHGDYAVLEKTVINGNVCWALIKVVINNI